MATIDNIAEQTGLARATVADILRNRPGYNVKTRARVLAMAKQLNYEPRHSGRALATGRTCTVGVILGSVERDVTSPLFARTLDAFIYTLLQNGYHTSLLPTDPDRPRDEEVLRLVRSRRVDGFFIGGEMVQLATLRELSRHDAPVVTTDRQLPHQDRRLVSVVRRDDRPGMYAMIDALAAAGHRRLLHIRLPEAQSTRYRWETTRFRLLRRIVKDRGIDFDPGRDVLHLPHAGTWYTERMIAAELAQRHFDRLLNYSAIVCRSDMIALGVADVLTARGVQLGCDITLCGHGNVESTQGLQADPPRLATVDPDNAQRGRLLAQVLLERITHPKQGPHVHNVPSHFVCRSSFGSARR